jgi:universal stress protein family protein
LLPNYSEKSANENNISAETILAQGYPPEVIIREAEAKRADLIVVVSRGLAEPSNFLSEVYQILSCTIQVFRVTCEIECFCILKCVSCLIYREDTTYQLKMFIPFFHFYYTHYTSILCPNNLPER